ncbi:M48 family metallopeptidase [Marinibacterium profundimaris]|uniref:Peptidase M48 n=1 Tax=Marinibacterium profundimaris TaxID=1679460 RepID=A0A225NBE3_9RHOB|nr:M48 family metallopeptidase [Marinibacterium profundimaris]OWU67854.1 peptidase M48 [Marinibacterium profundimaris]
MRYVLILVVGLLAGCAAPPGPVVMSPSSGPGGPASGPTSGPRAIPPSFAEVVARVEPVAERVCLTETRNVNCNFEIVVKRGANETPNAYQSLTPSGQPVLTVTSTLINDMDNPDELAFVLSHEAAHHIQGHLARQEENAAAGAVIFAGLASLTGGSQADIQTALELGAAVGARSYSKDFELEADALGTVIAYYAGYDPMRGAEYFARLPDPGNRFLGTHPPNAARVETVRRTLAAIR